MDQQDGSKTICKIINSNKFLSKTFKFWYIDIINQYILDYGLVEKDIIKKLKDSYHPHDILYNIIKNNKSNSSKYCRTFRSKLLLTNWEHTIHQEKIHTNSIHLHKLFLLLEKNRFNNYFNTLPPVSSTKLFLDKGTSPRMLFISKSEGYVVVKISSQKKYVKNYCLVRDMLNTASFSKSVKVVENIGVIKSGKNTFFISEFKGFDYETEIIENKKILFKNELFELSRELEKMFLKNNFFFRNLAPRNLIYSKDIMYLIDFDNVFNIKQTNNIILETKNLYKKLWFRDIFGKKEIEYINNTKFLHEDYNPVISADSFEKIYFKKNKIFFQERKLLISKILDFEKFSFYNGIKVYGHQLGRFISDFWSETSEVNIYKYLDLFPDQINVFRTSLYLLSILDQELLLRHKYNLNKYDPLLSEIYFRNIYFNKLKSIQPQQILTALDNHFPFNTRYENVKKLLKFK